MTTGVDVDHLTRRGLWVSSPPLILFRYTRMADTPRKKRPYTTRLDGTPLTTITLRFPREHVRTWQAMAKAEGFTSFNSFIIAMLTTHEAQQGGLLAERREAIAARAIEPTPESIPVEDRIAALEDICGRIIGIMGNIAAHFPPAPDGGNADE